MRYIALIISSMLFSSKGFAGDSNVPSGIFLSGNLGLGRYEGLTTTENHPPTPIDARLYESSKLGGVGAALTFFRSNIEINWWANCEDYPWGLDSTVYAGENCLEIKGGILILPSNWPVQLIPEVGYFSIKEDVELGHRDEKEVYAYKEEFEDKGTSFGGSGIWKINTWGEAGEESTNFLEFSYSRSNLKQIGIDNYSLQWKWFLSKSSIEDVGFMGLKIGMLKKTDGRKSYYVAAGIGLDPIKMFAYDSYNRKTKGSR